MIALRKMTDAEFPIYKEIIINEYGKDLAINYGHTLEQSKIMATESMAKDLPEGVSTTKHCLRCIDFIENNTQTIVGYLWYSFDEEGTTAFISDFYIHEKYRSNGYGKTALSAMEQEVSEYSVKFIKLRVAGDNNRALKLYQTIGFTITGLNMVKSL